MSKYAPFSTLPFESRPASAAISVKELGDGVKDLFIYTNKRGNKINMHRNLFQAYF